MKALGVILVTQPYFLTHMNRDNVPLLPGIKQLPLRSVLDAGVPVAGSSDWPVASYEPLKAIERAVSRKTVGEEVLQPREAVTVKEALAMYTKGAAHALNCEKDVGSLEVGKRADFVLLSDDPLRAAESSQNSPQVEQTWLGGNRVYCRSG
jgi:predicted amidohydrolase YtcJ